MIEMGRSWEIRDEDRGRRERQGRRTVASGRGGARSARRTSEKVVASQCAAEERESAREGNENAQRLLNLLERGVGLRDVVERERLGELVLLVVVLRAQERVRPCVVGGRGRGGGR